ncbi:MAG: phosphoglycerate dehydrogenase [Candidatus Schekmanbacteria bacterium]|nr:MAG: phosphoglycerate dehydrogenase [Candidatus Schekmanbacteria bacterium]
MKVLISDKISPEAIEIFKKNGKIEVDYNPEISHEDLIKEIGKYSALVIRSRTKVKADVIEKADNLKVIGRAGIGVDNVDIDAATSKGILVMNTPGGNTVTTAEHALSMMMSLARKIPFACASMKEGKWEKSKFMGVELFNKTLGIIGMGRIGSIVASRANGLKMKVIAYDPYLSEESAQKLNVQLVNLDELLEKSDFITIHTPLNEATKHIIGREALKKVKKGVRIINCSRGGTVDEDALLEALNDGRVAGAALDVFEEEPPKKLDIVKHENVICTPHLGASTVEAQSNVAIAIAEQISDYLLNGTIRNAVNFPSIEPQLAEKTNIFIELGDKLGSFVSQIAEGRFKEINIEYSGEVTELNTSPITASIVQGVLKQILKSANPVNSLLLAKERGIKIAETTLSEQKVFANLISVKLTTDKEAYSVAGSVFHQNMLRIVKIGEYFLEAPAAGTMLVFSNYDKPGVIGRVGTIMGEANINIAGMILGRSAPGKEALSIVNVDNEIPESVVEKIKQLPNALSVKVVKL